MGNIKNVKYIGEAQTYDLSIDHKDHQFYLSNGLLTSNSHAVLYSMLSYETAYLKAHYPVEFLLANLMAEVKSNAPNADENIQKIKNELRALKINIIPPNINKSTLTYSLSGDNLITGLDALKFVSDDAINDIISKRPFNSFQDFMARVDSRKVRANTIQALAASGCFDEFGLTRKQMFLYCSDYRKKLKVWLKTHNSETETFNYPFPEDKDWSIQDIYALEQHYLGEGLICGKDKAFGDFFKQHTSSVDEIQGLPNKAKIKTFKGEIKDMFEFKIKKETSQYYGQSMIKATIEDINGKQCSLTIFPKNWVALQDRIKSLTKGKFIFEPGCAIHFQSTVNIYEEEVGLVYEDLYAYHPIPQLPADLKARKVSIRSERKKKEDKETKDTAFEEIEDDMINEGLIDPDEEDD